jgi:hypothetical protein
MQTVDAAKMPLIQWIPKAGNFHGKMNQKTGALIF